jgi:phospholipase/lecithinase/hemolysin
VNRFATIRRSHLAAGVALLGCTLAATGRASAQNMQITTVTGLTLSGTGTYSGASPGFVTLPSTNWTGSATYLAYNDVYTSTPVSNGSVTTYFAAYDGGTYDFVGAYVSSAWDTDWNVAGSFTVVLSQAANIELFGGMNWLVNGVSFADGDLIGAGTHTFSWNSTRSTSWLVVGLGFHPGGGGGAIPLPGAAGLAACGLLAVGRRRRR